jgi:hypothetical protein
MTVPMEQLEVNHSVKETGSLGDHRQPARNIVSLACDAFTRDDKIGLCTRRLPRGPCPLATSLRSRIAARSRNFWAQPLGIRLNPFPFPAMSQLPLEIWVLIIDNLAEDQGRASSKVLAACSLVETRLIPLARKHLFEKLRFRARTLRQADARFQELEPVIAPYVRTFDVVCYNTVHDGEPMEFAKYVSLLATAVGSQVDTLILSRVSIPAWHKDSSMPLCTQAFPQLHHLCFDGVDFQNVDLMAHYLASCPLLRSFRLDGCDFENVDFRQEYALPPIQELVLYLNSHLDHILSWATRLGLASSLRCLKVRSFKDEDHEALAAFVATPSLQLSVLHIAIEYQWQFSGML